MTRSRRPSTHNRKELDYMGRGTRRDREVVLARKDAVEQAEDYLMHLNDPCPPGCCMDDEWVLKDALTYDDANAWSEYERIITSVCAPLKIKLLETLGEEK